MLRKLLWGFAVLSLVGCGGRSFQGQTPPELVPGGTWINADWDITLAKSRGKVVWLEFSFLG